MHLQKIVDRSYDRVVNYKLNILPKRNKRFVVELAEHKFCIKIKSYCILNVHLNKEFYIECNLSVFFQWRTKLFFSNVFIDTGFSIKMLAQMCSTQKTLLLC